LPSCETLCKENALKAKRIKIIQHFDVKPFPELTDAAMLATYRIKPGHGSTPATGFKTWPRIAKARKTGAACALLYLGSHYCGCFQRHFPDIISNFLANFFMLLPFIRT
jgi:hypothetical protein